MKNILVPVPDQLTARIRAVIPDRQRSSVIRQLLEEEVTKRERKLYECAAAVEKDQVLKEEMEEWDVTLTDGIHDESW
ncbi:MAG: hypothetical protein AB7F64_08940 [Gammaproteobacteria bacterium]